ncbi:MAG TPA: hypothetical protein O0X70_07360, partial [Methanocorpusculum sp.]|nr:hypothetical protein [Methanocorpusculum sp.]
MNRTKKNFMHVFAVLAVLCITAVCCIMPAAAEEHTHNAEDGWTELTAKVIAEQNYALSSGTYYLSDDFELKKTLLVTHGQVTICLNGHKLSLNSDIGSTIQVTSGATLIIDDCKDCGKITGSMKNRTHQMDRSGGVIYLNSGSLILENGKICEGKAVDGGGVFVSKGSTFEMNGGSIE